MGYTGQRTPCGSDDCHAHWICAELHGRQFSRIELTFIVIVGLSCDQIDAFAHCAVPLQLSAGAGVQAVWLSQRNTPRSVGHHASAHGHGFLRRDAAASRK